MAVVVEAFDVIATVRALEQHHPGGVAGFCEHAPNRTYCSDGRLCRIGFMSSSDRAAFVEGLAAHGLRVDAESTEVAQIHVAERGGFDSPWLTIGKFGGVNAAWLTGEDPEPLVVPLHYRPQAVAFHSREDIEANLEFVRSEGAIDVYRDRRTGKELYSARTQPTLTAEEAARIEAVRLRGLDAVQPFLPGGKHHGPRDLSWWQRRRLEKGIESLTAVVEAMPGHWATWWVLGMSCRALQDHVRAYECFERAYSIHPTHADVARELAAQCLILGRADEGVRISRENAARHPEDHGLLANLALALMIAGSLDEALEIAGEAQRDTRDPITQNLLTRIREIKAGRRPQPKSLLDL